MALGADAMIDKADAERIAQAVHDLRPEWPAQSVLTLIGNSDDLRTRAYRDLAVALTFVACDPASLTPGRVREAGPWWAHTNAQRATVSAVTNRCPEHPSERLWDCGPCREAAATDPDAVAAGLAKLREAAAAIPRRQTIHKHPEPPATDVRAAREAIDAEEAQP